QFDNAIYTNELHLFTESGQATGHQHYSISSDSLNGFNQVELTQQHIDLANQLDSVFAKIRESASYTSRDKAKPAVSSDTSDAVFSGVLPPRMEKYSYSRLMRAHIILRHARAASIRPVKATFYATLLECLLSSDDSAEV